MAGASLDAAPIASGETEPAAHQATIFVTRIAADALYAAVKSRCLARRQLPGNPHDWARLHLRSAAMAGARSVV